ncbi:YbaL family putative K(+) efflux transporter [Thermomonas flagellata]|uniref:YbaL family putative K(+) efflux transporter n=1 Tax=Thermomonas flagellata TaxID=2888524 RepID=UPI001F042A14|nr:YbaL family putative K(+) efflux transporter [Thermomonas flagellata]
MPHSTSLIALLCIGFVAAFALGLVARRLRLPPLVGYLLAGVLVGPFTPGFVADQTLAPQLAEVGVILLMFGVGLHFAPRDLLAVRAIAVPGALAQIAVATAMGWALAHYGLGWTHAAGLVFGLALSVASTVVLLRTLEDRRLLDTGQGRVAVGWLIVEDLAMVLALVLLPALAAGLGGGGAGPAGIAAALAVTLLKVAAFVAVMLVVGRRLIPRLLAEVAALGSRELFTLAVLAIALGVAFGAALLFGVSFALGAFFAGMLLNESALSHKAAADSLPMRDAFAVLFFVSVGMLFDPRILLAHPLHVLATLLIIVLGKSLAAWAIVRAFGRPEATARTIAASLAQIGEFSFILAGLGVALGLLPTEGRDLVLAGALLSILLNPLLFAWAQRRGAGQGADAAGVPGDLAGHVILVGYGRIGSHLAGLLHARGVPLVLVEADRDRAALARAQGLAAVHGNAADPRVLQEAQPQRAHLAILAVPNALEAGEVVARLKAANPALSVLARAHGEAEVQHLLAQGADAAVLAERELAHSLADMVLATPPYRRPRVAPG